MHCPHTASTPAATLRIPCRDPTATLPFCPAQVYVKFGNAGLHTLEPSSDQQTLSGSRDRDGDPCSATLVQ